MLYRDEYLCNMSDVFFFTTRTKNWYLIRYEEVGNVPSHM